MTTKADKTAAAQAALEAASGAHKREAERLDRARVDLERLDEQLGAMDPDAAGFGPLVAKVTAARARAEALGRRGEAAALALDAAKSEVEALDRSALRAELEAIDGAIGQREGQLTAEVGAFRSRIAAGAAELRELVARAHALDRKLGGSPAMTDTRSSSYWAKVAPGHELWMAAGHPQLEGEAQRAQIAARLG